MRIPTLAILGLFLLSALPAAAEAKPIRQLGEPRLRHGYPIVSIAYNADGSLLATAGGPLVRLFKPVNGQEVGQIELEKAGQHAVAFSPHGKHLAIAAGDQVILRELTTGKETRWRTAGDDQHDAVVFSPDGARLAVAGRGVTIWDVSAGKPLHVLKTRQPPGGALTFSANGKRIAAGDTRAKDEGCIRLWDVESGEPLQVITGVEGAVTAVAFTPDGQALVSASRRCSLQVWDVATGKEKRVLSQAYKHAPPPVAGLPDREQVLALSWDGKTLYSTGRHDDWIREWDLATGEALREFRGPRDGVGGLALSPNRKWLAVGGLHGSVELWHLESGEPWQVGERHTGAVFGLGFSANGKTLYSACTGDWLLTWDWSAGKLERSQTINFRDTECVLLGSMEFAAGLGTQPVEPSPTILRLKPRQPRILIVAQRWRMENGWALPFQPTQTDSFFGLRLAEDGRSIQRFNTQTHHAVAEAISGFKLRRPGLSTAGTLLPGGMKCMILDHQLLEPEMKMLDHAVRIANDAGEDDDSLVARMIELSRSRQRGATSWAVVAADGRSWAKLRLDPFSRPNDTDPEKRLPELQVREAGTSALLAELAVDKLEFGRGILLRDVIAFSPDGRYIALPQSGSILKIYEAAGGQERLSLKTGQIAVTSVAFTPDGQVLASGGLDGSIRLWDLTALQAKPIELSAQDLADCWDQLRGEDAVVARRAMWKLVDGSKHSLPFLREHMRPITMVPARRLDQLVAHLDSNQFDTREKAAEELERLGLLSEDRLREALKGNPSLEVRTRIETILKRIAPAARLTPSDRRSLRAVTVLEYMGGEEARKHLEALASGYEKVLLTQEAKRAVERK